MSKNFAVQMLLSPTLCNIEIFFNCSKNQCYKLNAHLYRTLPNAVIFMEVKGSMIFVSVSFPSDQILTVNFSTKIEGMSWLTESGK